MHKSPGTECCHARPVLPHIAILSTHTKTSCAFKEWLQLNLGLPTLRGSSWANSFYTTVTQGTYMPVVRFRFTPTRGGLVTFHWASRTQPRSWPPQCGRQLHWPQSWCRGSSTSASSWSRHPGSQSQHSRGQRCQRRTGRAGLQESGSLQPPVNIPLMRLHCIDTILLTSCTYKSL